MENKITEEGDVGISFVPCYRTTVSIIKPNQPVLMGVAANSYPVVLSVIKRGEYFE